MFDLSELDAAVAKFEPKKKTAKVYYYMFSKSGFTNDVVKDSTQKEIRLVDVDGMFEE